MTSPVEQITVECPSCATRFETSWRGSTERDLDGFDPDYVEDTTAAICPACGTMTDLAALAPENGVYRSGHE